MKIRIQDSSIRLRLTLKEVAEFARESSIARMTQVAGPEGLGPRFDYRLEWDESLGESRVEIDGASIVVRLCAADRDTLLCETEEGVYIRREWVSPEGRAHRFMAFVEKDRPGSTCVKKEQWIYDVSPRGAVETRPIPARKS